VNLENIVAGDGFIDVVAIGSIFTGNVSHTTQNANNTITLIAVGDDSDIGVGILSTGGAGNIRLIAGDDVNHSVPPTTTDPVGPVNPVDPVSPVDPVNPVDPAGQPVVAPANQLGNISADEGLVFNTTGSSVDPVITLFNGEGAVVFSSGNAIGNPVVLPSLPVGTYFVAVSGVVTTVDDDFVVVGGDSGGAFVLNVNDFSASGTLVANQVVFYSFTVGAGATNPVAADLDSTGLVTANDLFILADNLTADADSGIHLNTNIVSGDFQVDRGPNPSPNPGSITINEANTLLLDYAKTRLGTIDVTTGGNLVADFVQAEGINTGDAVTLTANGVGADVVTNEIRIRLSTGGVAINADDDIRDFDSSDDRFIIASSVSLNAGNNSQDAFNGIIAQTRTNLINAQVTSQANASAFIFNQNALRLENTFVTNGNIGVTNTGGNLQVADVSTGGAGNSRIFLRTLGVGSDISIGSLVADDRGEIFLNSADDIFDSVFSDDLIVEAEFLSATANNNAIEAFDGVILTTDVDSSFITQPNGGERFINEV